MKIVRVVWVDSATLGGWKFADEIEEKILQATTFGYLVKDVDKFVVIAQTFSAPEQFCNLITIPKASIIDIKTLEEE